MRTFTLGCQRRNNISVGFVLLLVLFSADTLITRADDAPARRAARLSYLYGNVTVDHLDNTAGGPAQVNIPLTEGTRLTTGEDGQAEVEFEDGSVVRLTPNTSLGLTALSVDGAGNFHTQLTVLHGLVYAELRAAAKFTYTVDAGGELVSPVANASMRINLDQPPAVVSVFDGTVHIERASSPEADGYKADVRAGETLTGDPSDSSRYFLSQSIEQDSWDVWNQGRDQAAVEATADRTTARDGFAGDQGYGWSDLDANGSWYDVPGQGQVWQPNVASDASFDPYGYGSWVAYPGAGYVWASGYGWGWTPFRCGNWSYWSGFGWGWSPIGCGLTGWGFGSVFVINIIQPPLNYRLPTRPIHKSGMPRFIPVGHPVPEPGRAVRPLQEPRLIALVPAEPLRPIGNTSTSKDRSVVGAALRSDFTIDRTSQKPVLGVVGATSAATARGDSRAAPPRPVAPPVAAYGAESLKPTRPAPPPQERSGYPAPRQGEYSAPRPSAPAYTPRPAPPPSPPPAPHPASTTPAAAAPK